MKIIPIIYVHCLYILLKYYALCVCIECEERDGMILLFVFIFCCLEAG